MKKYDNYKDSGIEWIGQIPEHWEAKRIKLFSPVKRGASPRPIDDQKYFDENGEYAWVRIADVTASDRYLTDTTQKLSELGASLSVKRDSGDFFLSIAGSVGKPMITKIKCCIHDGFVYFPKLTINPEFLYYIFQTGLPYLGLGKLGTQLNLNTETVGNIFIPIPSDEEIEIITNYLDHKTAQIDTLIAKKEQFISLLQEERTAIINQAVTKGLDPTVKMKDSGIEWLGEIPEHWEVKKLKLLANIQGRIGFKGYTVGDLVSEGEGALTLGAKHINKFNQLNLSNPEFISWEKYYESPEIMVQIGDIILTQRGTLGKVVLVTEDIGKATINPSMVILSKLQANDYFLYYFFNSDYFKSWIDLTNTATAVPMISQGQLGNLKLVLPNMNEQNQIVNSIQESIKKIDDIIVKAEQEIELLKEYKTALISEVVTGKVDVRDEVLN